jgi:hypothetical protein
MMEGTTDRPPVQEPPDDDKDGKHIQAESQSDTEPFDVPTIASFGSAPLGDIKEASLALKKRIDEAKRPNDMPLDSALGNPDWEESAADGHLDLPQDDD